MIPRIKKQSLNRRHNGVAMELRLRNMHDKHIAVVGVSEREQKFGYKIFRDLIKHHFNVQGVNPRGGEILGRKIYKDLRDMEVIPDLVIAVVPPSVTERIVEQAKQMGIREVWMQPGSESEIAVKNARAYGITVTANSCFMKENGIW